MSALAGSSQLLFGEDGERFGPLPSWVRFFFELGFLWPDDGVRRVAIVSTPCDSAAAGLIALGALVRRLGEPEANDLGSHKRRIRELRPGHKGTLRNNGYRGHYVVHRRDPDGTLWLEHTVKKGRLQFLEYHAGDWYFDGESPAEARTGSELPWLPLYRALAPSGFSIDESNLRHSDSSIVLAGRSTGQSVLARMLANLVFEHEANMASVLLLLALQDHQLSGNVSRIRYLNPRASAGREFDRSGLTPRTVIADGSDALLCSLCSEPCESASIIAHIPRTDDQSRLEEVGERLGGLRQWFELDADVVKRLPPPLRGTTVVSLRASAR
jgi:hypothetical protein